MTQGLEDSSAVSTPPSSSSPCSYPGLGPADFGDFGRSPEEETEAPKPPDKKPPLAAPEEEEDAKSCYGGGGGESPDEEKQQHQQHALGGGKGAAEGDDDHEEDESERGGGAPGPACCWAGAACCCCVCVDMAPVSVCLRSEKLCLLPIVACLLSLALCTAGLKWVFVDGIFNDPPPSTHLDPKRMGQDPVVILADPMHGLNTSSSSPPGGGGGPLIDATEVMTPSPVLTNPATQAGRVAPTRRAPNYPQTTEETNDIVVNTISATSTTPAAKTSSHVTRCSDSQKNFCVNGGECFTLEVTPGSTKFLCRCPNEFTGDRCQNYVMTSFYKAEELYQKRVLTISGICFALLVVGVMCVVAYCKTKKQRKKLHDRLRQSLRKGRGNATGGTASGPPTCLSAFENVTLVNQHASKDPVMAAQHAIEKETETSFSTSQYESSEQQPNMDDHNPGQSKRHSHPPIQPPVSLMPPLDGTQHATANHRGRLNATGGPSDLGSSRRTSRDASSGYRDATYSERYMFAVTTPDSPPSEMSAPLSDRSAAMGLSGEDERPLISSGPVCSCRRNSLCQVHKRLKRNSAHFNLGLDLSHSPPASPALAAAKEDRQVPREECRAAVEADPPDVSVDLASGEDEGGGLADKSPNLSDREGSDGPSSDGATAAAETSSCGSKAEEDAGACPRIRGSDGPDATAPPAPSGRLDGSWTESLRLSESDELQSSRLPSILTNQQQPIAV